MNKRSKKIKISVMLKNGKIISQSIPSKEIEEVQLILECIKSNFKKEDDSDGYLNLKGIIIRLSDISYFRIK